MEWFERVGFKKNDLLASGDVGYHQKIAGNIVSLYLFGKMTDSIQESGTVQCKEAQCAQMNVQTQRKRRS